MGSQSSLLCDFLDALGIEHDEHGGIDNLPETPAPEKLHAAVETLLAKYPAEIVAVYLQSFQTMDIAGWPALGEMLTADTRLHLPARGARPGPSPKLPRTVDRRDGTPAACVRIHSTNRRTSGSARRLGRSCSRRSSSFSLNRAWSCLWQPAQSNRRSVFTARRSKCFLFHLFACRHWGTKWCRVSVVSRSQSWQRPIIPGKYDQGGRRAAGKLLDSGICIAILPAPMVRASPFHRRNLST